MINRELCKILPVSSERSNKRLLFLLPLRKSERKHFRVSVEHYLTAERSSIASPQETDYWLHDREGRPLGSEEVLP